MNRPLVFISYSHKDEAEKDRLLTHLGVLRPGLIELWSDDDIDAGDDWEDKIGQTISYAKVAILLVTANFLTSNFILREEVPILLKRRKDEGLIVFPVIAKACAWKTVDWLRAMQVRPKYGNPVWGGQGIHVEEDLASIAEEVANIIGKERESLRSNHELEKAALDTPARESVPPQVRVTENLGASKMLIVDDDLDFRRSVRDIFGDTDITFVEAGSVEDAKEILDNDGEIRIILLDLKLPGENGTRILEHIIDRISEYRVIILTAHDELLPSREAAVYKVFQYLSKSEKGLTIQSLRFAVEQASQDIERERLAKANQGAKFDEVILNKYPTPFTYIYQELKSDLLGLEILTRQRDIFKLLLNFSAVALLCEYFNGGRRHDELDTQIRNCIFKPTLDDWLNIITETIKRKNLQTTFFQDRFSTFFSGENRRHLRSLIEILDRYLGQAVKISEFEYQEVIQRCDKLLVPLLQDYQFITDFLLCYVSSVQKVRGEYKYRLKECTGANPQLLFSRRDFDFLMNSDELHLVNLGNNQFCSLHPFIILEHCGECKQWEIFFYTALVGDQLLYTSYKTGHAISTETSAKELRALIGATT